MTAYEIIYDWADDYSDVTNIREEIIFSSWEDLQKYIKEMRQNGCYNISVAALYGSDCENEYGEDAEEE